MGSSIIQNYPEPAESSHTVTIQYLELKMKIKLSFIKA
jgi:hypothetical protein